MCTGVSHVLNACTSHCGEDVDDGEVACQHECDYVSVCECASVRACVCDFLCVVWRIPHP